MGLIREFEEEEEGVDEAAAATTDEDEEDDKWSVLKFFFIATQVDDADDEEEVIDRSSWTPKSLRPPTRPPLCWELQVLELCPIFPQCEHFLPMSQIIQ